MKTFDDLDLHASLKKAIEVCGYTTPTPVQAKAIPVALEGKDLVVSAQTGSGKTAAFVLSAFNYLLSQPAIKKPRILILTPTRELAMQVTKSIATYGKYSQFKVVSLVGGMPYYHQLKDLDRGADIIVATPGRLIDHIESKRVDLSNINMLILDEADRMLDMGFVDDVTAIAKLTPANRQTLLFSATIDKKLGNVIRQLLKNPVRIDLSTDKLSAPKIKQEVYRTKSMQHKTQLLKHFLMNKNIYKAIIFSATKANADKLVDQLSDEGLSVAALHGDLRQNVRNRVVEQFQRGRIQYIVATDVAARGIHVDDITHVFNYDLPKFAEDYVHRIGRTGRAGKEGIAISFTSAADTQHLHRIEKYIGEKLTIINNIDLSEREEKTAPPMAKLVDRDEDDRPRRSFHDRGGRDDRAPRRFEKREGSSSGRPPRREHSDTPRSSSRNEGNFRKRRDEGDAPMPRRFEKSESSFRKPREDDAPRRFAKSDTPFKSRRDEGDAPRRFEKRDGSAPFRKPREEGDAPRRFAKSDAPFRKPRDGGDAPRRFAKSDAPFRKPREEGDAPRRFAKSDAPFRKRREDGDAPARRVDSDNPRVSYGKTSKPWASKKPATRSKSSSRTVKGRDRGQE